MEDNIAIKVEHLSKVYKLFDKPIDRVKESLNPFGKRYSKDFYALNDVSFEIKKGETVGIIGKNGSGKSTLLKMITGVLTPASGEMCIYGKISALLELGTGFNPELTGVENIYMNGAINNFAKSEVDNKLQAIIDFADIGEFIYQPVKMYSSGMFARLAFAVAINIEPDILIVDEALSVGDVFFQNKCFKKFQELKDKNVTILFVSHDMGSVKQMTQKVLWLDKGKPKMFDLTEAVCEAYFNEQLFLHNKLNEDLTILKDNPVFHVNRTGDEITLPALSFEGRGVLNDDVSISAFFIKDEKGNIVNYLEVGAYYTVVCAAEFSKPMQNIIFGFVLENNKGVQLLGINSFINHKEKLLEISKPCIIVMEFTFVLPKILKGEYLLSPAIAQGVQGQNIILTWLPSVMNITVENIGYNLSLLEIDALVQATEHESEKVKFIKRGLK